MTMNSREKLQTVRELKSAIRKQVNLRKSDKRPVLTVSSGTCGQARGSTKVIGALHRVTGKLPPDIEVVRLTGA